VYSVATENEETLYQRIFEACETIRKRLETFERTWQSTIRRFHGCIDSGVEHFQFWLNKQ